MLEADGTIEVYQNHNVVAQYEGLEVHNIMNSVKIISSVLPELLDWVRYQDDCAETRVLMKFLLSIYCNI